MGHKPIATFGVNKGASKGGRLYSASVAKTLYLVIVSTCPNKLTEEPFKGESGRGEKLRSRR